MTDAISLAQCRCSKDDSTGDSQRADLFVKSKVHVGKPHMYKVFILNDDFTPMDFVVHLLETIFNKPYEEALRIMFHVHRKGLGLCGVYSRDVAETKISQVMQAAISAQFPLQCRMECE